MPSYCKQCGERVTGDRCTKCSGTAIVGTADTFEGDGDAPVHTQFTDRYVSSALDKDLNDGLRRMADVRPEWIDKTCAQCKKTCTDGAFEAPAGTFRGKALCEDCFARNFSKGECAGCHKMVIEGEYVQADQKIWHAACFTDEHRCATCRQPIFGEVINALGRDYHPKCFQCGKCQKNLTAGFVDFRGAAYCKQCADESKTSKTTQFADTNNAAVKERERNNAAAVERQGQLENLKQFKHIGLNDTCAKCSKEIISNGITINNSIYHEECFVCFKCGKAFEDGKYAIAGGSLYHATCAKSATSVQCAKCNKSISGKFLDYNGSKIHPECFTCADCKKSLAGQAFGEDKGKTYCENCMRSHSSRGPSAVHTGAYTPGFTVNPITGAKEERGFGGAKIGAPVAGLGTKDVCPGCSKPVYMTDKTPGPNMTSWHRKCLSCKSCNKWLDSMASPHTDGNVYCRDCVRKL